MNRPRKKCLLDAPPLPRNTIGLGNRWETVEWKGRVGAIAFSQPRPWPNAANGQAADESVAAETCAGRGGGGGCLGEKSGVS